MENIQNSQSGKMSEELLAQAKVKTSDVCWKDLHALSSQTFQFLDLQERTESGQNLERFPVMDGLLHGDCLTLNTGESPSAAKESRLSWILEDNVPQKFYLSARACQGILCSISRALARESSVTWSPEMRRAKASTRPFSSNGWISAHTMCRETGVVVMP